MCCFVFGSRYCFAIPKSTTCIAMTSMCQYAGQRTYSKLTVRALCAWAADQKVVWFYITVDKVLLVDCLYTRKLEQKSIKMRSELIGLSPHHLSGCHTHSLDSELPPTHIEKIFQTRPQQINDEDIVQALLPKMIYLWNPGWTQSDKSETNILQLKCYARLTASCQDTI